MSKQSAVAVANETEFLGFGLWSTVRKLDLTINPALRQVKVSSSKFHIGNGNEVVWKLGSLPGYIVEIKLGTDADPTSLSHPAGTTEVRGNIQTSSTAPPFPPNSTVQVPYSVSLRPILGGPPISLEHVSSLDSSSDPCLIIDRMGDPPVV